MANPNPPERTRWKKGQSGNPSGSRKLPADLKKVAEMTTDELKRTIAKHFRMRKEELSKVLQDPKSQAINLIIVSTIVKAIKDGDIHKAEYLFMRSLGRVTEKVEIQHPEPVIIERANGQQVALDVRKDED